MLLEACLSLVDVLALRDSAIDLDLDFIKLPLSRLFGRLERRLYLTFWLFTFRFCCDRGVWVGSLFGPLYLDPVWTYQDNCIGGPNECFLAFGTHST